MMIFPKIYNPITINIKHKPGSLIVALKKPSEEKLALKARVMKRTKFEKQIKDCNIQKIETEIGKKLSKLFKIAYH